MMEQAGSMAARGADGRGAAASFDVDRLSSAWLWEGKLQRLREMHRRVESLPLMRLAEKERRAEEGDHAARHEEACARAAAFYRSMLELRAQEGGGKEGGMSEAAEAEERRAEDLMFGYWAVNEVLPTDVHVSMFTPVLRHQTSPEQRRKWLPLAENYRILGAYAQTELGHGSNVRGLETTATFDKARQEFVLHTPTLTATKWWPGGLGHTATHCVTHARLIIDEKDYGIHTFMVQLRSLRDHSPMPGVSTGDIGAKRGFQSVDNGYARFNKVRIPRENMLAAFASVDENGRYSKREGAEKLSYGAMMHVRNHLVMGGARGLGRAVTIAARYSTVRHQGYVGPTGGVSGDAKAKKRQGGSRRLERMVMDYPSQQRILMPLIADTFALAAVSKRMSALYQNYLNTLNTDLLPELHAVSSGLKAFITEHVAQGIETARRLCGGHGYQNSAGFNELEGDSVALCTLEGTTQVLEAQTARYVLRSLANVSQGSQPLPGCEYLTKTAAECQGAMHSAEERRALGTDAARPLLEFLQRAGDASALHAAEGSAIDAAHAWLATAHPVHQARQWHELVHSILRVCELRATFRIVLAATQVTNAQAHASLPLHEALVNCSVELADACRAHVQLIVLRWFADELRKRLDSNHLGPDEFRIVGLQFLLSAFTLILRGAGQFAEILGGSEALDAMNNAVSVLCFISRQDVLALVEVWQFSPGVLNSALADPDPYESLWRRAQAAPLNHHSVCPGYRSLRTLIQPDTAQPHPLMEDEAEALRAARETQDERSPTASGAVPFGRSRL